MDSGEMFVSGVFYVLPSFCILSSGTKAHFFESFEEISLGPLIFGGAFTEFLLPDIVFSQFFIVHNPVASITVFEAVYAIIVPWTTSFVRSI